MSEPAVRKHARSWRIRSEQPDYGFQSGLGLGGNGEFPSNLVSDDEQGAGLLDQGQVRFAGLRQLLEARPKPRNPRLAIGDENQAEESRSMASMRPLYRQGRMMTHDLYQMCHFSFETHPVHAEADPDRRYAAPGVPQSW